MSGLADVAVVGAGPVGGLLAAELARRGVAAVGLERRADAVPHGGAGDGGREVSTHDTTGDRADAALRSRAVGLHATALAAMEASGATDRLLAGARLVRVGEARRGGRTLGVVRFDRLHARHPYVATLPQPRTEAALARTAQVWGAPAVRHGAAVAALIPRGDRVEVRLDDGGALEARIVVVAGGIRARGLLPLPAVARPYPDHYLMTDCADTSDDGDRAVVHLDPRGVLESFPLPGGRRRYVAWMSAGEGDPAARLREAVAERSGSDAAARAVDDASPFGVARSGLTAMRAGRVFAIGDTAHEVSPIGGQGMNLGFLDAVTLAPLLARWLREGAEGAPSVSLRAALDAWERARRTAASRSGRIAAVNTMLGRPSRAAGAGVVRFALATPARTVLAHAYAMGFDPAARLYRVPR